jgi:hypothetical protein
MNNGNTIKLKLLVSLLVVYLAVLFAVIVPLHQHNDFGSHNDCAVCAISHQPLILITSSFVQVLFILLLTLVPAGVVTKTTSIHSLHLRSPPAF